MRIKWLSKLVGFQTTKFEAIELSHEMLVRGGAPTDMLRAFKLNERVHQAWLRCVGCVLFFLPCNRNSSFVLFNRRSLPHGPTMEIERCLVSFSFHATTAGEMQKQEQ